MTSDQITSNSRKVASENDFDASSSLETADKKLPDLQSQPIAKSNRESILIIDFGSQYSRLIARRIRESKVYCEIVSHTTSWESVKSLNPRGIILSGGPASVYEQDAPMAPSWVYEQKLPILGICYGMQVMVHQLGGKVAPSSKKEYGHAVLTQKVIDSQLFEGLPPSMSVWMSHGDRIISPPDNFEILAYSENSPIAAIGNSEGILGIQFHPEVAHTANGQNILDNFVHDICGCDHSWTPDNFITDTITSIRKQVGDGKVICALSGGVDSAVAATLVHRAIGDQLTCIFVNNGLMRREEPNRVVDTFNKHLGLNLIHVDATENFLERLAGVTDPEEKRRRIGEVFIKVFDKEAASLGRVDFLTQGTLYPDVIESETNDNKVSAKIKTHHNVGGLPKDMKLKLVEPLRYLFKDEVREVGLALGLSEEIVYRQPFPGPGLAIRVLGEVTHERLETLRAADWIVMDEIKASNLYRELWQSFAVLTNTQSVGVTGDFRTYGDVVALRAVTSDEAMTADWSRIPYDVLARISNRIANEVPGINRVVYDITSKPPGTIEWE